MGELKDLAKKQSKFLVLDIGESTDALFVDYRIVPSSYDPTKDTVQYKLNIGGVDKFWTTGAGPIMRMFDAIPKGSTVRITRESLLDGKGNIVQGKSNYKVEKV